MQRSLLPGPDRWRSATASKRELVFQLSEAARLLRTYIDQRGRAHGMTRAQWSALARLARNEGMTQVELAEAMEMRPISVARLLDRLAGQGLVERRADPRDRRANRLFPTAEGYMALDRLSPLADAIVGEVLGSLDGKAARQMLTLLEAIKRDVRRASLGLGGPPSRRRPQHNGR